MKHTVARAALFVACFTGALSWVHADISLRLEIYQDNDANGFTYYYAFPYLEPSAPDQPVTFDYIQSPTGAFHTGRTATNNFDVGSGSFFSIPDLVNALTNGNWSLVVNSNDASQQDFTFTMDVTGLDTNTYPIVTILSPGQDSSGQPTSPLYEWTGPASWDRIEVNVRRPDYSNYHSETLPASATNWTSAPAVDAGTNQFEVNYVLTNSPLFTFSTPMDGSSTPLSGWMARAQLRTYSVHDFVVGGGSAGGHTLEAYYTFEDDNIFASDSSGNGNDVSSIASHTGGSAYITNDITLGDYAAYFDDNGGSGAGWLIAPSNLVSTLGGSFSVSLWVQTTQVTGNDTDFGFSGNAGIVSALSGPGNNWVVPMCITGDKVTFVTGGSPQDALHSTTAITNDSGYVHLVVTRDQTTGEKRIYVNGMLDATSTGSTEVLDTAEDVDIGYSNGTGFMGRMDEIQFYSGVLSPTEVSFLYNNPGSTVPNAGGSPLGEAVDAPELTWTTGGDADWFPETEQTDDGVDAAQSGAIDNNQSSWIETTVEGPGTVSFYWNVSSEDVDGYDYLELTVDGDYESDISGDWGWDYYEVYLEPGPHTLRWTYWKDSDFSAGADAGWLDEVTYLPDIEVSLNLTIERQTDADGDSYFCFPYLSYVYPDPVTTYEVESPSGVCTGDTTGGGSTTFNTLQDLIDELQAGPWTLYINRNDPSERHYTFDVTVYALDETNFPSASITSPALWATGVPTNTTFEWSGPTNFDSLYVNSYLKSGGASAGGSNLPPSTTTWTPPVPLAEGTNVFATYYYQFNYPDVELSDPEDADFNLLSSWDYDVTLEIRSTTTFVVGGSTPPAPVAILTPQRSGTNFVFSMLTQDGKEHVVQCRTNLTTAPWEDVTNFTGDGAMLQLVLPIGTDAEKYYRVGTQ